MNFNLFVAIVLLVITFIAIVMIGGILVFGWLFSPVVYIHGALLGTATARERLHKRIRRIKAFRAVAIANGVVALLCLVYMPWYDVDYRTRVAGLFTIGFTVLTTMSHCLAATMNLRDVHLETLDATNPHFTRNRAP